MRKYSKPQVVAKNFPTGSYASGCPINGTNNIVHSRICMRSM